MKKFLACLFFSIFILSGCEVETEHIDQFLTEVSKDERVITHLKEIEYIEEDFEGNEYSFVFKISGKLKDDFEQFSEADQYQFFAAFYEIFQKNAGKSNGDIDCGDDFDCGVQEFILKNTKHKYTIVYDKNESAPQTIYKDDSSLFLGGELVEQEPTEEVTEDTEEESDQNDVNLNIQTADGSDWVQYSEEDKYFIVNNILKNARAGGMIVDFKMDFFIGAVDSYYGEGSDDQADDLIVDIVAMAGVAEGLIKDGE